MMYNWHGVHWEAIGRCANWSVDLGEPDIREHEITIDWGLPCNPGLPVEKTNIPGNSAGDLLGMVKWPFQKLSDFQLGDKKVTN